MRPMTLLTLVAACSIHGSLAAQPIANQDAGEAVTSRVGPQIQLEPAEIDFGTIDDSKIVDKVVKLTNTGDDVLRIDQEEGIKGSCGCTIPRLDKYVLNPGETVELNVRFDARNRSGNQRKTVSIRGEGGMSPVVLPVNAVVVQRVLVVEGMAQFGNVDQGDTPSIEIRVRGMDTEFEVTEAIPSRDDMFSTEIVGTDIVQREDPITGEMTEVGETTVRINMLADAPIGRTDAKLTIKTTDPIATEKDVRSIVTVNGDVRLNPAVIRVGAVEPGAEFEHKVTLYSNKNRPFNVERVLFVTSDLSEDDKALITTSHEPIAEEDGRVGHVITFSGSVSDTMRIIRGKLVMVTDAPGQRVVSANVAGVVRSR